MAFLRRSWLRSLAKTLCAALPGLLLWTGSANAQFPQSAKATTPKVILQSNTFQLPIRMDDASRSRLREIWLFMKEPNGEWARRDVVPPNAQAFHVQMPRDGEYWFSVVTVDLNGLSNPPTLQRLTPNMIVMLDSRATQGLAQQYTQPVAQPLPAQPLPAQPLPSQIHVSQMPSQPQPFQQMTNAQPLTPQTAQEGPNVIQVYAEDGSGNSPVTLVNNQPTPEVITNKLPTTAAAVTSMPVLSAGRLVVNTQRVSIDYNINKIGPSGLAKVEVWVTSDQGQNWIKAGEDTDQRSPAEVDLPGEGAFGIRLVAINGNGFGGKAPKAGDQPTSSIEVDLNGPVVQSFDADTAKGSQLELRWRVSDKNLGAEPINLYYAAQRTGPWQPIAFKVKNDGSYRWTLPRDVPVQVFFRLEATDLAGNVTRCDSQTPVLLDMTEPDVNVVGITPVNPR